MVKKRLLRLSNWLLEILRRPVTESFSAPVAVWYASKASVARKRKVVPVSTMPALVERICVSPP